MKENIESLILSGNIVDQPHHVTLGNIYKRYDNTT